MRSRPFRQVDVFGAEPGLGNPLAVVLDGTDLDDAALQRFAAWTNLSETSFLLPPTEPGADYRVRIFTTERELPFAGHPTLGSAAAWLDAGGVPLAGPEGEVVQQCGAGLVRIRREPTGLAFAGPPFARYEPLEPALLDRIVGGLGLAASDVLAASWLVNGPEWIGLRLTSAATVLAAQPDPTVLGDLDVGLVGDHGDQTFEVRALIVRGTPFPSVVEDPVTGSLNAGLAHWLRDLGVVGDGYHAVQGTAIGRDGRLALRIDPDGTVWVGGSVHPVISGTVTI